MYNQLVINAKQNHLQLPNSVTTWCIKRTRFIKLEFRGGSLCYALNANVNITMSVLHVCGLKNNESPPLCTLVCGQEERDSTAVFTNMFSWVNTRDGGTRPCCKQIRPAFQCREGKIFWIHNIWGTLLTGCQGRVCLRRVAVCLGQCEKKASSSMSHSEVCFMSVSQILSNRSSII